jgi:hypothetical protein
MAAWGVIAGIYGAFLFLTALMLPSIPKRVRALAGSAAYTCAASGAATLPQFWAQLFLPAVLLLTGYWLPGSMFGPPQPWLERWLLEVDRRTFRALGIETWLKRVPMPVLEVLEAAYVAVYPVVAAGALISAASGAAAVARYWSIVLAAELVCYAALPYLRSRPPRSIERPGVVAQRAPRLRRLNVGILDRASVHANTLPSGHVAGAVAAALAVMPLSAAAGWGLMVVAVLITASAVVGRYHYAVDCVLGAAVAALVVLLASL